MRTSHPGQTLPVAGAVGVRSPGGPLLAVSGLAKSFGPTRALRDCSLELRAGQVHVVAGENGCGKSTLVKILSGVHVPDAGSLQLPGGDVGALRSPASAQAHGIFTVFQEVLVAEARSVLENVWLGVDGIWRNRLSDRERKARAAALLERLLGVALPLGRPQLIKCRMLRSCQHPCSPLRLQGLCSSSQASGQFI